MEPAKAKPEADLANGVPKPEVKEQQPASSPEDGVNDACQAVVDGQQSASLSKEEAKSENVVAEADTNACADMEAPAEPLADSKPESPRAPRFVPAFKLPYAEGWKLGGGFITSRRFIIPATATNDRTKVEHFPVDLADLEPGFCFMEQPCPRCDDKGILCTFGNGEMVNGKPRGPDTAKCDWCMLSGHYCHWQWRCEEDRQLIRTRQFWLILNIEPVGLWGKGIKPRAMDREFYRRMVQVHIAMVERGWMEPDDSNPTNPLGKPFYPLIPRTSKRGLWRQIWGALWKPEHRLKESYEQAKAISEAESQASS